jgi:hypothetical protein
MLQHLVLRKGAMPGDPVGKAKFGSERFELLQPFAAADMLEPPMEIAGQTGQRPQQDNGCLFLDVAPDAEDRHGFLGY